MRRRDLVMALGVAASLVFTAAYTLLGLTSSPTAEAACSALPTGNGTATVSNVTVSASGDYHLWARIISPSAGLSSVYVQVDSTYCNLSVGGGTSVPVGALTWVDFQNGNPASKVILAGLTPGGHTVTLAGEDPGVSVDKVLLLSDASCVPTGDGTNCQIADTPTPPPGSTPSPTPTPIVIPTNPPATPPVVSGDITLSSSGNLTDTTCKVDGKAQACSLVDTTKLSDGLHTVTVTGIDANGNTISDSETIRVKNHLTFSDRLTGDLHRYGGTALALIVLAGLGVGTWYLRHNRYIAPLLGHVKTLVPKRMSTEDSKHQPPPVAQVVYPSKPTDADHSEGD